MTKPAENRPKVDSQEVPGRGSVGLAGGALWLGSKVTNLVAFASLRRCDLGALKERGQCDLCMLFFFFFRGPYVRVLELRFGAR